jgi:hypothetical protein
VGYLAAPEKVEFPTENGRTAHMYYYPPTNADYTYDSDPSGARSEVPPPRMTAGLRELPPLLVKSHGGPTGATSSAFSLAIQFWTSRGIAVADVNYGGSTGYGEPPPPPSVRPSLSSTERARTHIGEVTVTSPMNCTALHSVHTNRCVYSTVPHGSGLCTIR